MSDFEQNGRDPDDTTLLASLYLDGEATPDERALVETSPETLEAVTRFGSVRTVLGATAPEASLSEREGHLAGALDVWARMSDPERAGEVTPSDGIDAAAGAAVTTPRSDTRRKRSERRRRPGTMTMPQWALGAAAALVMIAGVGAVVLGVLRENSADTTELAVEPVAEEPASEVDAVEADEAAEVSGADVGANAVPTESDLSDEAASPGLFPEDAELAADEAASSAEAPGAEQPAPPAEIELVEIETAEELGVYGSLAVRTLEGDGAPAVDDEFEPPFGTCAAELGIERELEPVMYQGVAVGVGVDLQNALVYAYTIDDCNVVDVVALPSDGRGVEPLAPNTQP
jgi:hypothetical protein